MAINNCTDQLIIFIKNPELGRVKTRIAAQVGNDIALSIYNELLDHTHNIAAVVKAKRILYYSRFIDREDQWSEVLFEKKLQAGKTLGQKMYNAIQQEAHTNCKTVLIGSDIGELTVEIISEALEALDHHDIIIGPAIDGGYYLIGMRSVHPIFDNIDWSTDRVLKQTIEKIKQLNLRYKLLSPLNDIDYYEDWENWTHPKK